MRKLLYFFLTGSAILVMLALLRVYPGLIQTGTGAPPYLIEDLLPPADPHEWIKSWERPPGPPVVGLQAGHWQNSEIPAELERLRGSTGASGGGKSEWEVNLAIAEKTKELLLTKGYRVDILPATIPVRYYADAFIAIHADGNEDRKLRGFKLSPPRRDFSGRAGLLAETITEEYKAATQLPYDPIISRAMRGYYAFSWWRYTHSVHPRAPAIILETGFLTNATDRGIIVDRPEIAAQGIAEGVIKFLESANSANSAKF